MTKGNRIIFTVVFPLLVGGLTYILFRADTLKMFQWFSRLGLEESIHRIRQTTYGQFKMPAWFIFSLPDALWLFSFTNLMLILWKDKFSINSMFWILLAPTVGIFSELGQAIKIVPGTFDLTDLVLLTIASFLPFIKINYATTQFKLV